MKVPNIRFNLKFFDDQGGEIAIRTIEDLKNNLNVSDLYAYMMDGTLTRWLRSLHETELVENIGKAKSQTEVRERIRVLLSTFDLEVDNADLEAIVVSFNHEKRPHLDQRSSMNCIVRDGVKNQRAQPEGETNINEDDQTGIRPSPDPLKRADFSGRSYYELLQSIRHKIKRCEGHWHEYPADPSQDIAEMLSYHFNRFVIGEGFKEIPEVIPFLYLDWPDVGKRFRFEKVGSGPYVIDADKCIACTACVSSCPVDAIYGDGTTASKIDAATCVSCGCCADCCPAEAISSSNEEWHISVDSSTTLPLPQNCIATTALPTNGRWLVINELCLVAENNSNGEESMCVSEKEVQKTCNFVGSGRELSDDGLEGRVKTVIVEQLGIDPSQVTEGASFVDDLGVDSLDSVELVIAFEEEFGEPIQEEDAAMLTTPGKVVAYLQAHGFWD